MKLYKNREEIRTDLTNVRYEMGSEAGELAKSSLSSFLKSCFFIILMIILSLLTIRWLIYNSKISLLSLLRSQNQW